MSQTNMNELRDKQSVQASFITQSSCGIEAIPLPPLHSIIPSLFHLITSATLSLNVYFFSPRFLSTQCPKGTERTEEKRGTLQLFLFAPPHREADEKFSWTMCSHLYPPLHHLYCASRSFTVLANLT